MLTKNTFKLSKSAICFSALGLGLLLFASGCSTMFPNMANDALPPESPSGSAENYYVELHPAFGKPTIFQGELDGPLTVQTALERSGATTKFKGMNIGLFRVVKENGRGLKLPVDYKYRTKRVAPEQDYALHPEDRIVVVPKSNGPLDKVMDSLNRD